MKNIHKVREDKQIKLLADRLEKIIELVKSKKLEPRFQPSMKTLSRIMKAMIENNTRGKTQLSLDTNLNYKRLANHIIWLEKKRLVESAIENNKINVTLTTKGREFASTISKIKL